MKKARRKAASASRARESHRPARRRVPLGPLFVFACATLFAFHAYAFRFTQDDAYISMRYAKNFAEGHGLAWNPGEPRGVRVQGFSNLGITLLMAVIHALPVGPTRTSLIFQGLNLGVLVACVLLTYATARHLFRSSPGFATGERTQRRRVAADRCRRDRFIRSFGHHS